LQSSTYLQTEEVDAVFFEKRPPARYREMVITAYYEIAIESLMLVAPSFYSRETLLTQPAVAEPSIS
jgi:hypothetical protein